MRFIDADALIEDLRELLYTDENPSKQLTDAGQAIHNAAIALAASEVADAPTIDAAPVVHAKNVTPTHPSDEFVCGNCGFCCEITEIRHDDEDDFGLGEASAHEYECKFCPECGAKMDEKEEDDNADA